MDVTEPRLTTHLERAVAIWRTERNPHRWSTLIVALPAAAQLPVRLWLYAALARRPGRKRRARVAG